MLFPTETELGRFISTLAKKMANNIRSRVPDDELEWYIASELEGVQTVAFQGGIRKGQEWAVIAVAEGRVHTPSGPPALSS